MEMVQAKQLVFEYEKRDEDGNVIGSSRAIDQVDLDVKEGQFIAILGHNGSGKSTLAKHINAILVPTEGTVWVDGRDTKDPEELWNVRQSAGMVFQNPDNQIIGTVVEEDVGFGPENLGVPTDEIWQRVEESLKAVGMLSYRYASPNKLSGGQKRRAAIAGVLAMHPKVLVLDEPTAGLDPKGRDDILEQIAYLHRQTDMTVILVSHSMEDIARYADRIIVMNQGEVLYNDTPRKVFAHYQELEQVGLAAPQVTYIMHDLKEQGFPVSVDVTTVEEAAQEIMKAMEKEA